MKKKEFDDLSDNERLAFIKQAFDYLCQDNSVPYGIQTGDDGSWDEYPPAVELAAQLYKDR